MLDDNCTIEYLIMGDENVGGVQGGGEDEKCEPPLDDNMSRTPGDEVAPSVSDRSESLGASKVPDTLQLSRGKNWREITRKKYNN